MRRRNWVPASHGFGERSKDADVEGCGGLGPQLQSEGSRRRRWMSRGW
jgi:hypothetical protein